MASNTERFDLLKKDPAVDGKDTFNIETMLNDNWDKLEKAAKKSEIDAHTTSKSNPHEVTKSQVGLGNVDNVKQAPKTEFDTHVNNKNNPHGVTKTQIGLNNVDNTKQATKSEFNTHVGDKNNPHEVTSEQINVIKGVTLASGLDDFPIGIGLFFVNNDPDAPITGNLMVRYEKYTTQTMKQVILKYVGSGEPQEDIYYRVIRVNQPMDGLWVKVETSNGAQAKVNTHANDKNNPHKVTAEQISLTTARGSEIAGSNYPIGITLFQLANTPGYPTTHGVIVNFNHSPSRFTQILFPHSGGGSQTRGIGWFRHWYISEWSDWYEFETTKGSQARVDAHENNKDNPHGVSSEQINVIKAYTRKVSDPYTSYPLGISTLFVGTGEPQGSWPVYGAVTTIKPYETSQTKGGSTIQFLTPYGTTSSNGGGKIRFRYLPYQETDWSDFVELAVADRVFTYDPNKPSASRSLDGYTTPGVYTLANGDSSSNAPGSSNNMSLLVMRNGDFMTQIVSIPETSGIVRGYTYIRYFGSNKWHSWRALVETPALSLDRVVLGENSSGSGNGAVSLGENAKASGNASVSLGRGANASSNFSTAIGAYSAPLNSNEGTLGGSESNTSNKWLVPGSFTVSGTKNFEIPHPHPDKKDTHRLRHSAVESPTAGDNLYRFTVEAVKDNETTKMLLPEYFQYLNKNVDVYVSPHLHFGRAYGVVENGELKVTCETAGEYKVLVIGTRNDEHQDIQDWSIKGVERENGESWTGETYVFEVEEIKEISEVM